MWYVYASNTSKDYNGSLKIIKNLEKDIENEKKIIELINKKNELLNAIKDAKKVTELSEAAHNSAKKYASLLIAIGLAKEIEEDYKKEKKLLNEFSILTLKLSTDRK